jgi:hypothetical protein
MPTKRPLLVAGRRGEAHSDPVLKEQAMRDQIRCLLQHFGLVRVQSAQAMRPHQRPDRNRRKLTLDELESRLAPSVTPGGSAADFQVDIDAADNVSFGRTDNFKFRVTDDGQDLDIQQAASSIVQLTVTATGNFANTLDFTGMSPADFVSLTEVTVNSGGGNDTVLASLFANNIDTIDAGDGDDLIAVRSSGVTVQGGNGFDTLRLDSVGFTLDLTNPTINSRVRGIEAIDLSGSGVHTLTLNAQAVLDVSGGTNTLVVKLGAGDTLNKGAGWTALGKETIGGVEFTVYSQAGATLKINDNAQITPPARPIVARLFQKAVAGKVQLRVRVRYADTGEIKREFKAPLQPPVFQKVKVFTLDTSGDGIADLIRITGLRNGRKVTRFVVA